MIKTIKVEYTSQENERTIHYFISCDGEHFYEINRVPLKGEMNGWEPPKGVLSFSKRWFGFGDPSSPFRLVEEGEEECGQ